MTHVTVAEILKILLLVWMGGMALTVLVKMLSGEINTAGLLSSGRTSMPDPERVSLLALTLGIAFYYTMHTVGTPVAELTKDGKVWMPNMPEEALFILGGGHGTYLGGKFLRLLKGI
ncbi:MAG: hypothetical protein PVG98_15130 [Chromatiales bacterium]